MSVSIYFCVCLCLCLCVCLCLILNVCLDLGEYCVCCWCLIHAEWCIRQPWCSYLYSIVSLASHTTTILILTSLNISYKHIYICLPAAILNHGVKNSHLVLPSGELFTLNSRVMILLETGDVGHASPALLVHSPHIHMSVVTAVQINQILKVWCSSVRNWLGHFPPWTEVCLCPSLSLMFNGLSLYWWFLISFGVVH